MIDCVYYNDYIRCYRDGRVERLFKIKGWRVVENTANHVGYNQIEIDYKMILRHRLIAFCFLGMKNIIGESDKSNSIDHINGITIDNRVVNLRITTHQGNHQNRTKAKGYYWNKQKKKMESTNKIK